MVGTIICEVGTINVKSYLLEVPYPQWYCTTVELPKLNKVF